MSDNEALFESEEDNDTKGEEKEGIIIANSHFNPLTNTIESVKQETTSSSNLNHNNDNTTLKTTLKGSKFKVNLLKKVVLSDDDKRVEDEDDTQNDDTNFIQSSKQSTNFKKRYQYKEQVHTASG